jgi:hypothetical protein
VEWSIDEPDKHLEPFCFDLPVVDTEACVEVDPSSIVWFHIQNQDFVMQADVVHELDRVFKVRRWDRRWAPVASVALLFPFAHLAQTQSHDRALQLNHGTRNGHLMRFLLSLLHMLAPNCTGMLRT